MKELVILIPSLRGGGLEKSILRLVVELEKSGVDLDFVVVNTINSAYKLPSNLDFINLNSSRIAFAIIPLISYLLKSKPQVLFSAGTPLNSLSIVARLLTGYPKRLIVGERNHLSSIVRYSTRLRDKLRPFFARYLYPLADYIIAVSESVAEDVIAVGKLDRTKVQVVYNVFDVDEIIAKSKHPTGVKWIDAQEIPTIMSAGRMTAQKDHTTLLRAFALIRKEKPCRLIILGDGELRSELEVLVDDLQIKDDVYMPGFVKNPYAYIARAKVFALSSAWEGLPAVLIEALACGVSIVSTDSPGGASEILRDGEYGRLVSPHNPVLLAEAIQKELDTVADSEKKIMRAREFSVEHIVPNYISYFRLKVNEEHLPK